jgi:hypothetical protein
MTKTLPVVAALARLATPAQAQQDDTLYRAAYCVGVFNSHLRGIDSDQHRAALKENCEKYSVCTTADQVRTEYENKRQRYVRYIFMRRTDRLDRRLHQRAWPALNPQSVRATIEGPQPRRGPGARCKLTDVV